MADAPPPFPPLRDPLVTLIIPIYNERFLIGTVLERVMLLPFRKQVVCVDDCSHDGTWEYLNEVWKPRSEIVLARHEVNAGKGSAIRTGLQHAQGDIVLVQDADLEYQPEDLPRLIQPIVEGRARVVYGSRFMGRVSGMRLPNRVANWLLAWMTTLLYGQRITDEATAYKIFVRDAIDRIDLTCRRFEFCPEVTAKARRNGERILELPVTFDARTFEEGKKIGWRDFVQAVWVLLKNRF